MSHRADLDQGFVSIDYKSTTETSCRVKFAMHRLAAISPRIRLFPPSLLNDFVVICYSITLAGDGIVSALPYLGDILPDLRVNKAPCVAVTQGPKEL